MTAHADRHLLFGLLALQNGLIDQGQLMLAFQAWTRDKARSLADHLQARGDLTAAKRALLDALAEVHLEAHDGDVAKSPPAAVPASRSSHAQPGGGTGRARDRGDARPDRDPRSKQRPGHRGRR